MTRAEKIAALEADDDLVGMDFSSIMSMFGGSKSDSGASAASQQAAVQAAVQQELARQAAAKAQADAQKNQIYMMLGLVGVLGVGAIVLMRK